jgi:16S rRNA (uracil1498-N3)-methyltransferase
VAHLYLSASLGPWAPGDTITLTGDEAHHAARVGRLTVGETTAVGDGNGVVAQATVAAVSGSEVTVTLGSVEHQTRPTPEIWLAQALAKGDRDELAIQASTELGIDRVIPYQASRSISTWSGDKVGKGVARWTKIVTEATKQALRAYVPHVSHPQTTPEVTALAGQCEVVVLDPHATELLSQFRPVGDRPILLVVGPEGGLSPEELSTLEKSGATRRKLGESVLRTSSAGPAALAVLNVTLGRW